MKILLEHWKYFQDGGLVDVNEIITTTEKYKNDNDIYQEFIDEYIVVDNKSGIKWTNLQSEFVKWYNNSYKKISPNTKEIKQAFIDKLFKCKDTSIRINGEIIRGWCGYKFNDV
jgi:hypothetical protein